MAQVAIHNPNDLMEFTETAIAHLRGRLEDSGAPGLKLSLRESGCSGHMYELDYFETAGEQAQLVRVSPAVSIFVPREQLHMVQGTRVDYVTEGLNAMLRFENPRAQAICGCGESFSLTTNEHESPSLNAG